MDPSFLKPGFDPKHLTVAQLRRILLENDVRLPSKVKKARLVRLFNVHVRPKLEQMRDQSVHVQESAASEGVDGVSFDERKRKRDGLDDVVRIGQEDLVGPLDKEERKQKRLKTGGSVIESGDAMDQKIILKEETITTTNPNLSKLKVSPEFAILLKNSTRGKEDDNILIEEVKVDSSSSASVNHNDTGTLDRNSPIEEKKDKVIRSEVTPNKDSINGSSSSNDIISDSEDDGTITIPNNNNNKSVKLVSFCEMVLQNMKHCLFNIFMFTLITSVTLFILWYREQRIRIGYCGVELPPQSIVPAVLQKYVSKRVNNIDLTFIDNWLYTLFKPNCLPCPHEAICFSKMTLSCKPHYRKIVPLLSLNGLIPLSPYCIPDIRRNQFLDTMFNIFLQLLRKQNGRFNCGKELVSQEKNSVSLNHLHNIFAQNVDQEWTQDEVSDLWDSLVKKLQDSSEIETFSIESNGSEEDFDVYFRSTSQVYSSLWCKYGNQILTFLQTYKLILLGFLICLFIITLVNCKRKRRIEYRKRIEKYVTITVEIIKNQTGSNNKDGDDNEDDNGESFLHTLQLRDTVLTDIVDLNERKKIWKDMTKILKNNKEIISAFAEINGEIIECWSWRGEEDNEKNSLM